MKKTIGIICLMALFTSCVDKKVNTKSTDTTPSPNTRTGGGSTDCSTTIVGCSTPTPTPTPTTTPLVAPPDLPSIIGHGNVVPSANSSNSSLWSSETVSSLSSSYDQSLFFTDSTFQVRIMAKSSPGQTTSDSYGKRCGFYQIPYTKLTVDVKLRAQDSGAWSKTYTFADVVVGQKSEIKTFSRIPLTSDPMIVEITRVQWDFECTVQGRQHLCPYAPATNLDCWELGLEISTDSQQNLQ